MIQSVIQSIVIAVAIVTLVAASFTHTSNPLGEQITKQIKVMKKN